MILQLKRSEHVSACTRHAIELRARMARQFLNEKKLKMCREIGGQSYEYATVRGGDPHFVAICEWSDDGRTSNSDLINYRTGKFLGAITRNGLWMGAENKSENT
jgi:hypothetical protein